MFEKDIKHPNKPSLRDILIMLGGATIRYQKEISPYFSYEISLYQKQADLKRYINLTIQRIDPSNRLKNTTNCLRLNLEMDNQNPSDPQLNKVNLFIYRYPPSSFKTEFVFSYRNHPTNKERLERYDVTMEDSTGGGYLESWPPDYMPKEAEDNLFPPLPNSVNSLEIIDHYLHDQNVTANQIGENIIGPFSEP